MTFPRFSPTQDIRGHPWFRGGISRGVYRLLAERVTPLGRLIAFVTLAFFHFTICSLDIQSFVIGAYLAVLWLQALIAHRFVRPRVQVDAAIPDRVRAGGTLFTQITVTGVGGIPAMPCRALVHRAPRGVAASEELGVRFAHPRVGETVRLTLGVVCAHRGVVELQGFRIDTAFPFGLLLSAHIHRQTQRVVVYPRFTPLAKVTIAEGRRYQPGGVTLASKTGDAREFWGNREYRPGDAIRDIDWRATARLGSAVVREYREEYFLRAVVVLDAVTPNKLPGRPDAAFERAVSTCAAVADYFANNEFIVDIFAAGSVLHHLTAGRSLAYLDQILEILAVLEPQREESLDTLEPEIIQNLARITTVICIFLDWDDHRRNFALRMREEGTGVKVILIRDGEFTRDPGPDSDYFGGIPVLRSGDPDLEEL